ncbi:MAG: hypothetical protein KGI06_01250 [Candidatus Micrarchaeota archaeon]|nr:hypothetical protein [Candidatus Micrarchaeota archaeon]
MNRLNIFGIMVLAVMLTVGFAFAGTSGPAPIPPPPNFQISTNVITLCKGMLNSVPISIKTPKGAAVMENVQLSLTNSRYAYTVGNGTVSAVNVTANATKTVPLMVFVSLNATPLISTGMSINYQYLTLYTDTEVRNISFGTETCATPLLVSVSPGILTAGRIQNVTLNFTNTGNTVLNYLSIHASLPGADGTFLGLQPIQISSIAPKGSASIKEEIYVFNNASQSFPINMSVNFYNVSSLVQMSVNPIMLSSGLINITPSSTTLSPPTPASGSIFSISFVLTNVGTTKASAVTATALAPKGFSSYGTNSTFVGDMAVDTQTPVTLTLISQGSLAAGNYTIPVRVNYLNNLRQNLSTTIYVPVEITKVLSSNSLSNGRQGRSGGGSSLVFLALIIIVIAVLVLFLMERGKHKKLKEEHRRLKSMQK